MPDVPAARGLSRTFLTKFLTIAALGIQIDVRELDRVMQSVTQLRVPVLIHIL